MAARHQFKDISVELMKLVLKMKVQKCLNFLKEDIERHFDKQLEFVRQLQINKSKMSPFWNLFQDYKQEYLQIFKIFQTKVIYDILVWNPKNLFPLHSLLEQFQKDNIAIWKEIESLQYKKCEINESGCSIKPFFDLEYSLKHKLPDELRILNYYGPAFMQILKEDQKYKEIMLTEKLRDTQFEIKLERLIRQGVHVIFPIFICLLQPDNMVLFRPGMITESSLRNSYEVTIYWCCEEIVIEDDIKLISFLNYISQDCIHPAELFDESFFEMSYNHLVKIKQNSGTLNGQSENVNNENAFAVSASTPLPTDINSERGNLENQVSYCSMTLNLLTSKPTQIVTSSRQTYNSSSRTDNSSRQTDNSSRQTDNSSRQTYNSSRQTDNSSRQNDNSSRQNDNSSRQNDNSSRPTDNSSRPADNSSRQNDNSSRQNDKSSRQTDNSSRQNDNSSRQNDNSSRQNDNSSRQNDNSSRQNDNSSRQSDNSSRQSDNSSSETDNSSRETDNSSRQTDNSSRQTDNSSRQDSNIFSPLFSTSPSKWNTIEDIYFIEINSKSKYSDFEYFSFSMEDDELKKAIDSQQIPQFGLCFEDLKPNKRHLIFFVSSCSVAIQIHALAEISKRDSKNKNFCLNIIHEELIEIRDLQIDFCRDAIIRLDDAVAKDLLKLYCKAAQKAPGRLRNIGNSCYMNSILQCLNACFCEREIENILVELNNDSNLRDKNSLSYDLFSLLNSLHKSKDTEMIASDLKNNISLCSAKFGTPTQQDAFDCLMQLLNNVEKEMSSVNDCKRSIIKEKFGLQLKTKINLTCPHKIEEVIQEEIVVHLSLEPDSFMGGVWKNLLSISVSLESCWEAAFKSGKHDELLCQACPEGNNVHKGSLETFVDEFPKVLIIYINRFDFKNGCKNNRKIEFKIDDFKARNSKGKSESYRAVAFCEHYGTIYSGHYISYVRGKSDDIWFLCNDLHEEHSMGRLKDKVISHGTYLIFYKRKSTTI